MRDKNLVLAVKILFFIILILISLWLFWRIASVIRLLLISLLIVYFLHPAVNFLERRYRFHHGAAVAVVFTSFLLFCIFLVSLIVPVINQQLQEIAANFPEYLLRAQLFLEEVGALLLRLNLSSLFSGTLSAIRDNLGGALDYVAEFGWNLVLRVVDVFFALFIVFYLLYDLDAVKKGFLNLIPIHYRDHASRVIQIIGRNIGGFIRGLLLRGIIVALLTWIALLVVDMPYALLLAIIAGLFNLILYIGPYFGAVPAVILSLSPETPSPLLILLIYVVIQFLDGVVFAPILFSRAVNLKPITVIVALIVGLQLGGLVGMFVAVPIAGAIKQILELFLKNAEMRCKE